MRIFIVLFFCISFSSCNEKPKYFLEFKNNIVAKRIKYENKVYQCLNNFDDRNLKRLYDLLAADRSFISLYTTKAANVYYSDNKYKAWSYVNYQYCKESIDASVINIKCSLGRLSYGSELENGTFATTNPSASQSIDSVLCLEYNIDEFSPALFIFFDNKKIEKTNKITSDDKITAKASSYATGKYILIDTMFVK